MALIIAIAYVLVCELHGLGKFSGLVNSKIGRDGLS